MDGVLYYRDSMLLAFAMNKVMKLPKIIGENLSIHFRILIKI